MHDLPSLRASGTDGEVRVGYQRAARLGAWTLTLLHRVPRTFQLRARLIDTHDYWFRQSPQDLILRLGLTEWTWPNAMFVVEGDDLVADLEDRPRVGTSHGAVKTERESEYGKQRMVRASK